MRKVQVLVSVGGKVFRTTVYIGHVVLHRVTKRGTIAYGGGMIILCSASALLHLEQAFLPIVLWETICVMLHGVGLVPFLHPIEKAVSRILDTKEEQEAKEEAAEEMTV